MSYPPYGGGYGQPPTGGMPQPGGGYPPGPGGMPQPGIGFEGVGQQSTPFGGMPQPGGQPAAQPGMYPQSQPGYPPSGGYPPTQPPQQGFGQTGYPANPQQAPGQPGYSAQPGYPANPQQPYGQQQPGYGGVSQPPQQGYPANPQQAYSGQPQGYPANPPPQQGYPSAPNNPPQQQGYPSAPTNPPQQQGYSSTPANPSQQGYPATTGYSPAAPAGGYGQTTPGYSNPNSGAYAGGGMSYQPATQGVLKPHPGFDPERDAVVLRKAMKGLGTDEKAIIDILGYRTTEQRVRIRDMYRTAYGRDLVQDLKSELSGNFEDICVMLTRPKDEVDAAELRHAMEGMGTKESTLIEILCSRSNAEIKQINEAYKRLYRKPLEHDIRSDTSGHFRKLLVSLSTGNRMESQAPDRAKAARDAQALYQAGEKRWGTDEGEFNRVFGTQSIPQLRLVFEEYSKISRRDISSAISNEMSGDVADAYHTLIKVCRSPQEYFAERLYKAMKGAGTRDRALIRIIVTRAEIDMVQIKQMFQSHYGKTLESFISGDTSGDYKKLLLALVGGR